MPAKSREIWPPSAAWKCFRQERGGERCSPGPAAKLTDQLLAEGGVEAWDQLACHEVELLRPHGRLAGDRQHPSALAGGAGGGGDGRARGGLPRLLDAGEGRRRGEARGELLEGGGERAGGGAAHAAIASWRIAPGEMRRRVTAASQAPGTWERSVVAITLCPPLASSRVSSSRRSPSSSLMTSSRSISGVWVRSRASTWRSPSSRASRASRCSPCEPNTRSSRSSRSTESSLRWGPCPVKPRSRSRSR